MNGILEKYGYVPDESQIGTALDIILKGVNEIGSRDVLMDCFSMMDLTTLHTQDTPGSVDALVSRVKDLQTCYPDYPLPASICVYPNFAAQVARTRPSPQLHVTAVSGCFPSSQSFLEVKEQECSLAVLSGADEIDIVLALNAFEAGDYNSAANEIICMKRAADRAAVSQGRKVILKVILETGVLKEPSKIAAASFLAMESGADFIKTSTGKVDVNATPQAAYVMCESIRAYFMKTGRMVGFKAAGGISSAEDALCYYAIVKSVLGKEWLCKERFRFGVSRLANNLMSAIEQTPVTVF